MHNDNSYNVGRLRHVLSKIQKCTDDFMYIYNLDTDYCVYTPGILKTFALDNNELDNASEVLKKVIHPEDYEAVINDINNVKLRKSPCHNMEYRWKSKNGMYVWISCRGELEVIDGVDYLIGRISEIGKQKRFDNVTGLYTDNVLESVYKTLSEKNYNKGYLLIAGIDNFKEINEKYGVSIGDGVLAQMADVIKGFIDIHYGNIFRMSGDECAILVVDDDTDDNLKEKAKKIYKEIRYRIDENIEKSGYDIFYNISAGATGFDAKKDDFDKIIQKARFSLHSAKIKGKNRFNYFNENEYEAYIKKLGIQDELRRCINNDFEGFKLVYQPIVSNSTEKVIGAEALLIWESTKYGYMSPVEFIPLLEESALIIPLGKWITKTAACQCDKWVKNIPDFVMHINLSFVQIVKSDAIRDMVENISKFTPSNSHYVFEVTESVQMDANSTIQRVLDGFNENGFALAIDDFGTGYSNFGYMKDKVFGILKIDRSFITDIQSKHNNYTLVNFMIKMAHEMGISVCIEGVETKEELDCVSVLSPDFIQGYYYGKPVDEDTFYKMHLGA